MWSEGEDSITIICYRERFPIFIYLIILLVVVDIDSSSLLATVGV